MWLILNCTLQIALNQSYSRYCTTCPVSKEYQVAETYTCAHVHQECVSVIICPATLSWDGRDGLHEVCKSTDDGNLIACLKAIGYSRELAREKLLHKAHVPCGIIFNKPSAKKRASHSWVCGRLIIRNPRIPGTRAMSG